MFRFIFLFYFPLLIFGYEKQLFLGKVGSIRYIYDDKHLLQVDRLAESGELLYCHTYHYDEEGFLTSENLIGGLGQIVYEDGCVIKSPYTYEKCDFDGENNLVKHIKNHEILEYTYDDENKLILNDQQKPHYEYSSEGKLIKCGNFCYSYDEEDRLSKVLSSDLEVTYKYDSRGMRISKKVNGVSEFYMFLGLNELAIFDESGNIKELRVPGLSIHQDILKPIAIETKNSIYCPIHDVQGNIIKLIDIYTKEEVTLKNSDPFGRGLEKNAPVSSIFSYKSYDSLTDLVYFGNRFYSPVLGKWLTPDPEFQTEDIHQYCLNNPLRFFDPDGRYAIVLPIVSFTGGAITFPLWGPYAIVGFISGYVLYEGYQHIQNNNNTDYKRPKSGISGKEGAKDIPSWAEGERPFTNENGNDFAKRLLDDKYGYDNYRKGPDSEFNKIKKWGDRSFE